MNCCAEFNGMNVPALESRKILDLLFPGYFHKIKSHIFQHLSKCSINELIPFKYKNICKFCDGTQDKENKGKIMSKKSFVLD